MTPEDLKKAMQLSKELHKPFITVLLALKANQRAEKKQENKNEGN